MTFKKATKAQLKLRMALSGPAGSGKTYTALTLAQALAQGQPVAVIDTERGSASKYADLFDFDVMELDSFHPQKYVEAIHEAVAGGYAVIVIDSLSHAWSGKGGILEIVQRKGNSFQAWGEVKPIEAALIEAVTGARIHVIATMRSKVEYVVEKDERTGKSTPRKVGMAPVQRDGMEYEFDVFGELDQENTLTIQKTRCPALAGALISKPGKSLAETLRAWLAGAPPSRTAPEPQKPRLVATTSAQETLDEDEAIYYAAEDESESKPEPEWQPLADAKFIASLREIRILSVTDQEKFVAQARAHYPDETLREACKLEYASHYNALKKAKATRGRGPSAIGAMAGDGEATPDSLESLETGARAS